MLSIEALTWLTKQGYQSADHETRMALIKQAKQMFGED